MHTLESLARARAIGILAVASRIAPQECRDWAEAMRAEPGHTPGAWEHLSWAAGCAGALALSALRVRRIQRHALQGAAAVYLLALMGVVVLTSAMFRELYSPVAGGPFAGWGGALMPRDQAVTLSEAYRSFVAIPWYLLAAFAGAWAAAIGLSTGRLWKGIAALAGVVTVTACAFVILPPVYFPFDQYPAPAAWLFVGLPVATASWFATSLLGWILPRTRIA